MAERDVPFPVEDVITPDDQRWKDGERRKAQRKAKANGHDKDAEMPEMPELPALAAYKAQPFEQIPLRQWLHARHYIRRFIVMTVAPGGYGKTALVLCNAIEMALGTGLLGPAPPVQLRVLYWNGEDPDDEIARRIAAVCLHYQIDPAELEGWLFLGNKVKGKQRLAHLDRAGNVVINQPVFDHIDAFIRRERIDCAIIDPLLPFHRIPEAKNELMEEMIANTFGELVERYNCCIELSHHTRKTQGGGAGEISVDDSRGGGAVTNVARSVRIINRMTKAEGEAAEVDPDHRRYYLRVSRDKVNLAPAESATWVHLRSQELPNGPAAGQGDNVQVVAKWDYPKVFDGVSVATIKLVRDLVARDDCRKDPKSPDWIGLRIAGLLDIDAGPGTAGRRRINKILKAWFAEGVLTTVTRPDGHRKEREFVIPGNWTEPEHANDCASN
jgi:hypothetical protein